MGIIEFGTTSQRLAISRTLCLLLVILKSHLRVFADSVIVRFVQHCVPLDARLLLVRAYGFGTGEMRCPFMQEGTAMNSEESSPGDRVPSRKQSIRTLIYSLKFDLCEKTYWFGSTHWRSLVRNAQLVTCAGNIAPVLSLAPVQIYTPPEPSSVATCPEKLSLS